MDYNARYYSPYLGRFVSPDTVVPGPENPQAWNRYAYTFNNPLKHTDPTGHCPIPPSDCPPLSEITKEIAEDLEELLPDTYSYGWEIGYGGKIGIGNLSGGASYGQHTVWDFQHNSRMEVHALSTGPATPGVLAAGVQSIGWYGGWKGAPGSEFNDKTTSAKDFLGPVVEVTGGGSTWVRAGPVSVPVTAGVTGANSLLVASDPNKAFTGLALVGGLGGPPGPSGSVFISDYAQLGSYEVFRSDAMMSMRIVLEAHHSGQLYDYYSGTWQTALLAGYALLH